VFLAPVHKTVEGHVYFDLPSVYSGSEMNGIYMEFKEGKVIKATAEQGQEEVDSILNTDEGARYLGELGIGTNFNIQRAMRNTLFDEKIGGTIHLALGRSYEEERGGAPNDGNVSAIHWDIVKNMKLPGSILYIDNKPLLKEGKFLLK
jgi:aminopeptidase